MLPGRVLRRPAPLLQGVRFSWCFVWRCVRSSGHVRWLIW